MARYVSMLRGINVAGQKKIKMDDLVSLYVHLGLKDVVTYIQSGNVVFDFNSGKEDFLKVLIEKEIERQYGFSASVHNCNHTELKRIIKNFPFDRELADAQGNKYHVTFLSQAPEKSLIAETQDVAIAGEQLIVCGTVAYLHCPGSFGKSKLSNNFLEKKLQVSATTRNWKTILKLFELST
ncbi:MAG: DUF1697 domain-containing protein [Thiohalomonadales bacterium]